MLGLADVGVKMNFPLYQTGRDFRFLLFSVTQTSLSAGISQGDPHNLFPAPAGTLDIGGARVLPVLYL